jgi:thymidine kinase
LDPTAEIMELVRHHDTGWIEVICGPMFSGKSEELIRRLRRAQIARLGVMAFKPRLDNRYADDSIASHSSLTIPCTLVDRAGEIPALLPPGTQVVGIDEAQFLGEELPEVCGNLAERGLRVICAGLDMDYRGVPWEPMPRLLAQAECVDKMLAICVVCGNPASRTQRKVAGKDLVLIGAAESYEARCRRCHTVDEGEQTTISLD